uniref:Thaumatin-like protein n=1 Tax=Oryza barthii TaxID=65489 RepID=A0A0D3FM33_9ORYZ
MASLANSSVHLLLLVVVLAAAGDAVTFTIVNKCGYTVWPAALPSGDGNQLDPGQSWAVYVPAGTKGARVWGRTGCGFISGGSLGQCQTGDCGGTLRCAAVGAPPVTCPGELRAKAGCSNPCRGNSTCGPTKDTEFFKKLCPETVTYAGTAKAPPSPAPPAPTTRSSSAHDELGLVQGQ